MQFPAVAILLLAQAPLPELKTEATDGGSVFIVRNISSQPLTDYLIELVNYPGSFYMLWQDVMTGEAIPPGGVRRIPVTNMTVGAVPDYVKLQAARYADGSTCGVPERLEQLLARRAALVESARELIGRLEKAGTDKSNAAAELRKWAESIPPASRSNRNTQAAINQAAARGLIHETAARLEETNTAETLAWLRAAERNASEK
jgi:hypothetical protein